MPTRAMRLKTQAHVLACLQAICLTLSVVKEQSLFASLMRLEKELFPLYLRQGECLEGRGGMILPLVILPRPPATPSILEGELDSV